MQIENYGPSPAAELAISFLIPSAINNNNSIVLNSILLNNFSDNSNIRCTINTFYTKKAKNNTGYIEINRPQELNFANLTFLLDCSQENILCEELICTTGPLLENEFIVIPLQINFSSDTLLGRFLDPNPRTY